MTSPHARRLARVNVVLIIVCSIFLLVCIVRQLWVPALVNAVFIVSNSIQLATARRSQP